MSSCPDIKRSLNAFFFFYAAVWCDVIVRLFEPHFPCFCFYPALFVPFYVYHIIYTCVVHICCVIHRNNSNWSLPLSLQRHVSDFYISDFQSGLRALVKTGYGARVTPYVEESIVVDIDQSNRDMSPEFVRWLAERNLSSDDRIMRLKEGYGLTQLEYFLCLSCLITTCISRCLLWFMFTFLFAAMHVGLSLVFPVPHVCSGI